MHDAGGKMCEPGSSVWFPQDVSDRHSNTSMIQQTEEELLAEEEEDVSGLAAPKQVTTINIVSSAPQCSRLAQVGSFDPCPCEA